MPSAKARDRIIRIHRLRRRCLVAQCDLCLASRQSVNHTDQLDGLVALRYTVVNCWIANCVDPSLAPARIVISGLNIAA